VYTFKLLREKISIDHLYKSFYGTLLAINKDTAWHHIKEEELSLEKYFHALFILKPLLDKVQYWLESNFIVCKCSWQIVFGGGRVFYIFLYLHRMILSSLPYKNMLLLQLHVNFEATCACNGEWSGYYCSGKFIYNF
jgi:hypothetical protein